jgi:hypothetical protein
LITPLSFCHHRKHPEIRSQNRVFQQPARNALRQRRSDRDRERVGGASSQRPCHARRPLEAARGAVILHRMLVEGKPFDHKLPNQVAAA